MVLSAPPTTCTTHRKRDRVAACGACGSALCTDCVVHTSVGVKCRKCTGVRASAAKVDGGLGRLRHKRWPLPVALAGLLVAGAAAFAIAQGGGDGSSSASGSNAVVLATAADRNLTLGGAEGLELGATLTLPAGAGADPVPGVLIVPGGATLDRNNLRGFAGSVPNPLYEDLSIAAVGNGMAVLRYDRRGTGSSRPDPEAPFTFEQLVGDAQAGVDFLAVRRETSGAPLALVGYDDGGLVALNVAAADPRVTAVVLVSTTGRPLVDYLAEDFVSSDPTNGPAIAEALRAAAAEVQAGRIPSQSELHPNIRGLFPDDPTQAGYVREIFSLDPVAEAQGVTASVLYMRGASDPSITDADVAAFQSVFGGSMEVMVGAEADHTMMLPVDHGSVVHEGGDETPRDQALLNRMAEWLVARLA